MLIIRKWMPVLILLVAIGLIALGSDLIVDGVKAINATLLNGETNSDLHSSANITGTRADDWDTGAGLAATAGQLAGKQTWTDTNTFSKRIQANVDIGVGQAAGEGSLWYNTNTRAHFQPGRIMLNVGDVVMIDAFNTTQDLLTLGASGSDVDVIIGAGGVAQAVFVSGSDATVTVASNLMVNGSMGLATGATINDVATTITSNDTSIATGAAILEYGAANWAGGGGSITNLTDILSAWSGATNWLFIVSPDGTQTNLISKTVGPFTNELTEAGF